MSGWNDVAPETMKVLERESKTNEEIKTPPVNDSYRTGYEKINWNSK